MLWSEAVQKWPESELVNASPDHTGFKVANRFSLGVALKIVGVAQEHTSIAVTDERPKSSLKEFTECAEAFFNIVTDVLELQEFIRIGLRLMFVKDCEDLSIATKDVLSTGLITCPVGPHFGIDGKPSNPNYIMRWESDSKGAMIHLTAETRKLEFSPPPEMSHIAPIKEEKSRILYDLDYYTRAIVTRGQFRPTDWIDNASHLMRRDSAKFLGSK